MKNIVFSLIKEFQGQSLEKIFSSLAEKFPSLCTFSSSLGVEDQIITDIIWKNDIPIQIFTLDTGRLFPETYRLFYKMQDKYKKNITVYFPDNKEVEKMTTIKGMYSFYDSVENRKECCKIRKIEPLKRALKGKKIWITGLRSEQSENRAHMELFEWDENMNIIKCNPLIHWTMEDVNKYVSKNGVPINLLHSKGFPSIGCQPCTRAVNKGQDFRSGRWWWESSSKECGLHQS